MMGKESTKGAEAVDEKMSKKSSCPLVTVPPYCIFHGREGLVASTFYIPE